MKKDNIITYALDYESYFDRECSIRTLGPLGYFSHPDFDAYLVSVVGDNGYEFVGHPKDFDWSLLEGNIVLAHNASFDETLYLYGVTQNWWPEVHPAEWHCTADMAAACGLPRALKGAIESAFSDIDVSKETRNNMMNKRWENMTEEFKKEVLDYALLDSSHCLLLWKTYAHKWPQFERDISAANRRIMQRGLPVDAGALKVARETLNDTLFKTEQAIPWAGDKPLLSRKAYDAECIKLGLEPPASLAKTDVDAQKWIEKHGRTHLWIQAVSDWRRINSLKKKLESFENGLMADGRYYGNIMYWGGHTGRFSGGGGNLNLQNLPRADMFGINMRNLITAPKGKKLVVVDLSQIEVRTLCWLAGDKATMAEIAASDDIYEAFAIQFGLWSKDKGVLKKEAPEVRRLTKNITLGCGYGCGAPKFATMCDMPLAEAEDAVALYRKSLFKVPKYWRKLDSDMKKSYAANAKHTIELPSGRSLDYGLIKMSRHDGRVNHVAMMNKSGRRVPMKLWGGTLAENASQALARDVFSYMMLKIEEAGIKIIFHVHDEVVIECDEEKAEGVLAKVVEIMSTPPEWISDIPLSAEGDIVTNYTK